MIEHNHFYKSNQLILKFTTKLRERVKRIYIEKEERERERDTEIK